MSNTVASPARAGNAEGKVWIDLDNSPHVPLFKPIVEELARRKYNVVLTARNCFQVAGLVEKFNLPSTFIGRHYGKNKALKVVGTCLRAMQLRSFIQHEKPTLAVSHGSRSQLLTATMLGIPTVLMVDYEYNQYLPGIKPSMVLMPEVLEGWMRQTKKLQAGLTRFYPGIKEDVYVPQFHPDPQLLDELGISPHDLVVTIRPPATEAHYHKHESETLFEATLAYLGVHDHIKMIMLPRTGKQAAQIAAKWPQWMREGKIVIPEKAVDGLNLIWYSDFVISGGGTMNREAATLGVPVYSIFRGTIGAVDHYLSRQGRLVLLESPDDLKAKLQLVHRDKSVASTQANASVLKSIVDQLTLLEMAKRQRNEPQKPRKQTLTRV